MSRPRWQPVYFGLGSNLDEPMKQLRLAVTGLAGVADLTLYAVSSVVKSAPVDGSEQPDYLNAVVAGLTRLEPLALLDECQRLEATQGRDHAAARWSARRIDIDILSMGRRVHHDARLTLPHGELTRRAFVLSPWAEIASFAEVPGLGQVHSLLRALDAGSLQRAGKLFPDALPNGLS